MLFSKMHVPMGICGGRWKPCWRSWRPAATWVPARSSVLLGTGGMGTVYNARDTRVDRTVAIKISAAQFSGRFDREARAVAALNHPHIGTLYDVGPIAW
jgi:hypothetical protein